MTNRRLFLKKGSLGVLGWLLLNKQNCTVSGFEEGKPVQGSLPSVIATWAPNTKACAAAWEILSQGGKALDAVEAGAKVPESDPNDNSVGLGGLPDRDGKVTVDACIMNSEGRCGSVVYLEQILHPISVARKVMEETPHVMLAGKGAQEFAISQGFELTELLTEGSYRKWKEWLKSGSYNPKTTTEEILQRIKENHDTIGILALDSSGDLSGACTTSGMAYKMNGRVGDSPLIGSGLFVDNEVGAATGSGLGEAVIRICGAHAIVELMRQGFAPEVACKEAIHRLVKVHGEKESKEMQVGFIALDKQGRYGGYSLHPEFTYAVQNNQGEVAVFETPCWFPS